MRHLTDARVRLIALVIAVLIWPKATEELVVTALFVVLVVWLLGSCLLWLLRVTSDDDY